MMKKSLFVTAIMLSLSLTSCDVLNAVADQLASVANLMNCEYKLKDVTNVTVAGVNVKNVANGNISATDVVSLAAALTTKKVPLAMNVNINVKNPTSTKASLNNLDWILAIEGSDFAQGSTTGSYNIAAGTNSTVPLGVSTDLYKLFSQQGIDKLKSFASSFASDGTSSKVDLKIKPSLTVGTAVFPAAQYITLSKTVGRTAGAATTTTTTNSTTSTNTTGGNNSTGSSTGGSKPNGPTLNGGIPGSLGK